MVAFKLKEKALKKNIYQESVHEEVEGGSESRGQRQEDPLLQVGGGPLDGQNKLKKNWSTVV